MSISKLLKSVALPLASSFLLGPTAGKGLGALFGGRTINPIISNALVSGGLGLLSGQKPKDALRSALVGGLGGTALQNMSPGMQQEVRTNVPNIQRGGPKNYTKKSFVPEKIEPSDMTFSANLANKLGFGQDTMLGGLLNTQVGEGIAAGLVAQLASSLFDEEEDERTGFERRPFGFGGPGGQIGGINYANQGGVMAFPRRDGGIMPSEGSGTKDDVPAMLTAGEFVLTKDAVKGLGNGNQRLGIQRAYDMMGNLEEMA